MLFLEYYCFIHVVLFLVITAYNVWFLGGGTFFCQNKPKRAQLFQNNLAQKQEGSTQDSQHSLKAPWTHYYPTPKAQTSVV